MHKNSKSLLQRWEQVAQAVTEWSGKPLAFGVALLIVVVWAVTGPLFNFSDTWQLVINTGTTIVTFLMVFLIQQTQNKDTQALELKLNQIVAAVAGASNRRFCGARLVPLRLRRSPHGRIRLEEHE